MKKLAAALALIASVSAFAGTEPVLLATTADGETKFYGHPESFKMNAGMLSMVITMRDQSATRRETSTQAQIAVTSYDCARGTGPLFTRPSLDVPWDSSGTVSMTNPKTVADRLSATLCEVAAEITKAGVDL